MPEDWGGIERYVTYLTVGLRARGHEVLVTAPTGSPLSKNLGEGTVPLRVRAKYDFWATAQYLKLFKSTLFEVVNTHFSPDYLVPAWAAKIARGPKMVMTRHLVLPFKPSRARSYSKLYDLFIGVSQASGAALTQSGLTNVHVAHAGVPPLISKGSWTSQTSGNEALNVGIFGRLVKEKGHQVLIEAQKGLDRVHLHIFGQGPERPNLETHTQRLGLERHCSFHGQIDEVADAMSAMDVVAIPSLWAEAFSIAVLEAMSLGKPIVASRIGGIPEALVDEESALLLPPGDAKALSLGIERLQSDPGARKRLGTAANRTYRDRFTVPQFAARIEGVYSALL